MAPTTKRLKVIYTPPPQIPTELWACVGKYLPIAEACRLGFLEKKLSQISNLFPVHLNVISGGKNGWVANPNQHPKIWKPVSISRIVKWLKNNQAKSLTVQSNQGHFDLELLGALAANTSCNNLKISSILNDRNVQQNTLKSSALLEFTRVLIANKPEMQKVKIACKEENGGQSNFTFDTSLLYQLSIDLSKFPIKTLKLMFETQKISASTILGINLFKFNRLKHLLVTSDLGLDFWNSLKRLVTLESLVLQNCKLPYNFRELDKGKVIDAISSILQLKSFSIVDCHGDIVKHCMQGLLSSKAKLEKFNINGPNLASLSSFNISEEARKAFFQKIASPQSPIKVLHIVDPILFIHLKDAPWESVDTKITLDNLFDLCALEEREKRLSLYLNYQGPLTEIIGGLQALFPNGKQGLVKETYVPGKGITFYQQFSIKNGINLQINTEQLKEKNPLT